MMENILRAIKDWSIGKFQPKGDYLTEVPDGVGGYTITIATEEPAEVGEKEIVLVVES